MKKIELLAPAGDLNRLKIAVMYGADAVYIGGKQFSLRSRASNFGIEEIAEGVKFANKYGAKIHVTCNILPHEEDFEGLKEYLQDLERVGVTAIIVASYSIMKLAKEVAPKLEVHVSTQHSSTNSSAMAFWQEQGMDRVVLARECTLEDVQMTCENAQVPVECFIHGGMCISYSGRCTLSNNMTNRDANRGGCAQSCRWKYHLYDMTDEKELSDEEYLFSMSSKDLCAAEHLKDLIDCGVASLKIEGRMKSAYYLATIVRCYRMMIDEIYAKGDIAPEKMLWYQKEFAKAENRLCADGFYSGSPTYHSQLFGINGAGVTQEFIAYVLDYDEEKQVAKLEVRNNFACDIDCEVFGPNTDNTIFKMPMMYDENGESLSVCKNPMDVVYIKTSVVMQKHDMIRKILNNREKVI